MRSCQLSKLNLALLLCWVSVQPLAAQPEAYARHWPVQVEEVGMYAVTLPPELYAQIERPNLDDLAAFNGAGEALGFEPLASMLEQPEPQWTEAVWFSLPVEESGPGDELSFQVERRADGSLSVEGSVGGPSQPKGGGDLLIDTGIDAEENVRLTALRFTLDPQVFNLSARIRIEASHDLESWKTVVASAGLLRLQQGGQLLERRRVELPNIGQRYLRLRRLDEDTTLPLTGLEVQTRAAAALDPRPMEALTAEWVSRDDRTFFYRLPARIPIEQVHLHLAQDNAVAGVSLAGREDDEDPWRPQGQWTAFRLRAEGVELDNEPLTVRAKRYRQWRVTLDSDVAEVPTLEFMYRPERWLLLTQGKAPYLIAAGSSEAERSTMPLSALLEPIRDKYGADWQPPEASLGEPTLAAGESAIETPAEARAKERRSGIALWLILILSALAIAFMVLRLMGERPNDDV